MTTLAPGSSDERAAAEQSEHARLVRKAHDASISRAEGWRLRGPLLPALIFMIVVTQIPFLFTLYYSMLSWNLVRPGSRRFVGLQNYLDVVKDGTFWQVAFNTVFLIVGHGADLGGVGAAAGAAAGSGVCGSRRGAHAVDHPVSGDTGGGGVDVEDRDAGSGVRHHQLGAARSGASTGSAGSR